MANGCWRSEVLGAREVLSVVQEVGFCNNTLDPSPLMIVPISSNRLLALAAKRRGRSGMRLDPVLNT